MIEQMLLRRQMAAVDLFWSPRRHEGIQPDNKTDIIDWKWITKIKKLKMVITTIINVFWVGGWENPFSQMEKVLFMM